MKRKFNFKGQNILITGGSRGLGLSMAWNALKRGGAVTLVARKLDELEAGREMLRRDYPNSKILVKACDITDPDLLEKTLKEAIDEMGSLDLLINNAGSILVGPFASMKIEDFEAQMRLHLYAVIYATKIIEPYFRQRGGGRILNICSLGGKVAVPHMLPYDVSKFALAGFSQGVAPELAREKIYVTTVYPTVMRTGSPIQAVFKGNHEKEFEWFQFIDHIPGLSMSADEAAKKILDAVETGRSEVILSLPAKLRLVAGALFPDLVQRAMGLATAIMPTENSYVRKTGADSQDSFNANPLMAPFRSSVAEARANYNQTPKHDAEFNMGIKGGPHSETVH